MVGVRLSEIRHVSGFLVAGLNGSLGLGQFVDTCLLLSAGGELLAVNEIKDRRPLVVIDSA
eukprot:4301273-Amphidinium_carterae.1